MERFILQVKALLIPKILCIPIALLKLFGVIPFDLSSRVGMNCTRLWNSTCMLVYSSTVLHFMYINLKSEGMPLEIRLYLVTYFSMTIFLQLFFIWEIYDTHGKDYGILTNFPKLVKEVYLMCSIKEIVVVILTTIVCIIVISFQIKYNIRLTLNNFQEYGVEVSMQGIGISFVKNYEVLSFIMMLYGLVVGVFPSIIMFLSSLMIANIVILLRTKLNHFLRKVQQTMECEFTLQQNAMQDTVKDFHKLRNCIKPFNQRLNLVIGINIGIHIFNICASYYAYHYSCMKFRNPFEILAEELFLLVLVMGIPAALHSKVTMVTMTSAEVVKLHL